ncbi:MAG TPA: T9SS type A sorting domain-containing protein, partial [Bacteroidales bacterium]|nr:T9SS type A sorting domain-containing protein [Bacteroidales bacterium]
FVNHINVSGNMVEKYSDIGILLHNADYVTVENNLVAGNTCLALLYDFAGETYRISSSGNEFFGLNPRTFPLWIQSSTSNLQLDFKDNVYANPYNPVKVRLKDPSNDLFLGLERWKSDFGKDGGSVSDDYNWNLMEVKDTLSENLVRNGSFDSGIGNWTVWFTDQVKATWESSAGMDGGAMKLTGNSKPSAGYMRTYTSKFSLKKDHIYMVTGSFKASVHTTLYLESENAVTGWEYPNFSTYLPLVSSVRKDFHWVFSMPNEDYQSDLYVQMPWHSNGQWLLLDNMGVYEVTATEISPYSRVFFFANPSRDRVEYSLKKAKFTDVRGKQYAEKLTLEPWSGKILILTEGTFSLEEPPEKTTQILLYPNPVARGQMLTVALTGLDSSYTQMRIVSSAGRIMEVYNLPPQQSEFFIATLQLSGGIYYLQLFGKNKKMERSFVVVQNK